MDHGVGTPNTKSAAATTLFHPLRAQPKEFAVELVETVFVSLVKNVIHQPFLASPPLLLILKLADGTLLK